MAVFRPRFAAQKADSEAFCIGVDQAFNAIEKKAFLLHDAIHHVAVFITTWVLRTLVQHVTHKHITNGIPERR